MSTGKEATDEIKISIGMPVYNGESHISKALDSLVSQTFSNFELIISDNNSTDSTPKICQDYAKKDKRIFYIRQPKNIGGLANFHYVLGQAKYKYFMWAAADDVWEPTFIEKNIRILECNKNLVGSISEVDTLNTETLDSQIHQSVIKNPMKYMYVHPLSGTYEEKVAFCLGWRNSTMIYGIYRTDMLRKSLGFNHVPQDLAIIMNVVKYGDIHVVDEILMHRSVHGISSKSTIHTLREQNVSYFEIIFMYVPLLIWLKRNFGIKFILKNISSIAYFYYIGYGRIIRDLLKAFK